MSSSLRRGALAAAAIAFSIASLAACGAGNDAQTLQIKPDNAATTVGDISVQNAVIITQPGTQTKGPAVVSVTVFNNGNTDQTLDAVRVAGAGDAQLTPASGKGKLTVPANGSLILGGKGNASAALPDLGQSVQDGNAQKVTFTFSKDGDVSLRAYVVPAESYFDKWGPSSVPGAAGAPAATATATATAGESGKPEQSHAPSESASGSPAGSKTGEATPSDSASQSASSH
ncbi:copper chaperone PCu(A)C [Streptomyces thermodiastaticus]|uniref:copper chaperone PCu(A)C n=1 Tax=Streptomyces thermodiastaticus TaxID=44061 RepID=UPI0016734786|nr:copper chaperone PCu(A)C [Streptomyces thermodiastaticus]MCE7550653.1 copper chaperone PCu(A)C [Streptomyces thermodiastaticus]GHF70829.1 lipoprotein [Streptomyces thermodiastaticus]